MNTRFVAGLAVAIAGALAAPGASAQKIYADTVLRGGKIE